MDKLRYLKLHKKYFFKKKHFECKNQKTKSVIHNEFKIINYHLS